MHLLLIWFGDLVVTVLFQDSRGSVEKPGAENGETIIGMLPMGW
jgi:hypothetical protein